MSAELSQESRGVVRRGRLSPDYAAASLSLGAGGSPPVGTGGRLAAAYRLAVAELEHNPSALFRVLLDERFDGAASTWPHAVPDEAQRIEGGYRVSPRRDNQFVAIGAPVEPSLHDVLVGATFRKLGGPPGGAYGLVVRDRGPGPRDGHNQLGRFYVAQVDDRGEVGIWRREQEQWFELVPRTPSGAVRPGAAANDLSFEVVGGRLTFIVNGQLAASASDAILDHGGVGLFVSGNGNEVLVERFIVHALV